MLKLIINWLGLLILFSCTGIQSYIYIETGVLLEGKRLGKRFTKFPPSRGWGRGAGVGNVDKPNPYLEQDPAH